jgi:serine phosphatase RsbU (regulator of sigma subunit)
VAAGKRGLREADGLREIAAVTTARVGQLPVEELLGELLARVRALMRADTAAVLLLDEPTGHLVATAAHGIEEEVYQGARVPLGRGFAGRIAASQRPVVIDDIADADVVNPLLRANGVRSLVGVPLVASGRLLGVLHVGSVPRRRFRDAEIKLLEAAGERLAQAVQASLLEAEHNASVLLQRSLLPPALPEVPGLDAAFRYIAGSYGRVGGDWYDLFQLPSGAVCVSVGDVVGKGLPAAAVMGRLRNAVRGQCFATGGDPAGALDMVDRTLRHFEPGEMATSVLGVLDPPYDRVRLAAAGHPAPILAVPGRTSRYLDLAVGPPLGIASPRPRAATSIELPEGATLAVYTDGLVERRHESLTARIEQLVGAVTADPPEDVCGAVMARMIGLDPAPDDVALLVVRRSIGDGPGPSEP